MDDEELKQELETIDAIRRGTYGKFDPLVLAERESRSRKLHREHPVATA